jgi:glycosyltransferase involved in cell wall biosynthesis
MFLCIVDHLLRNDCTLWRALADESTLWHLESARCAVSDSTGWFETYSDDELRRARHVPATHLSAALARLVSRPRAIFVSGLARASLLQIAAVARVWRVPVLLASTPTINEPSRPGVLGTIDAVLHATEMLAFAGFVTSGVLGRQYLVSLGCAHDRIGQPLHPVDMAAWRARMDNVEDRARELRGSLGDAASIALIVSRRSSDIDAGLVALGAVARARREGARVQLLHVGTRPSLSAIEERARALGMGSTIRSIEIAPHDPMSDVALGFAAADFLLHVATSHGWGHGVLQAMACSVPVIASTLTDVGADVIVHGRNGALCQADNLEDVARAIHTIVDQLASDRASLRTSAARAAERFDVRRAANDLAGVVERARAESHPSVRLAAMLRSSTRNAFGRWSL